MPSLAPACPVARDKRFAWRGVVPGAALMLLVLAGCGDQVQAAPPDGATATTDAVDAQLAGDTGCTGTCDDGNPCTTDSCTAGHCVNAPVLDTACDDGNPCTTLDQCTQSGCVGTQELSCDDKNVCTKDSCDPASGCVYAKNDGVACDDGDGCTLNDACLGGKCGSGAALTCDDGNLCTTDTCDLKTGCQFTFNTAPCTDGDACTLGDVCSGGKCLAGTLTVCADGNPCTDDKCDGKSGDCVFLPSAVTCDDGNPLTQGDTCFAGQCVGTPGCGCTADAQCDDQNPCTKDVCTAGCCVNAALPGSVTCSDGNSCTQNDACDGGSCIAGAKKLCEDGNICTDDACLPDIGCTHTPNAAKCDDGIACTINHVCQAGACTGNITACACSVDSDCSDNNPCTDDACVAGKCSAKPSGAGKACEDGNACTVGDTCLSGTCLPGAPTPCDDGNTCTNDACDPTTGSCIHAANFSPCSDGNACTANDGCSGGKCHGGGTLGCDDANPCTDDSCDPTSTVGCAHAANAGPCDDGSACTKADACAGGVCLGQSANACDDGNPCTDDGCDQGAGGGKVCAHAVNNQPCDDFNPCTIGDICAGVVCAGTPTPCDDQNPCTDDSCGGQGVCQHTASAGACSDGNACTVGDSCTAGSCVAGVPDPCDDQDSCTADSCDPASGCSHSVKADGAICLGATCSGLSHFAASTCLGGACVPGAQASCDDANVCSDDACDAATGCSHANNTAQCDDGNLCTTGDVCGGGVCLPGAPSSCDDGNVCSVDGCDPAAGCEHTAATDGTACASAGCVGLVLGKGGACAAGACVLFASPVNCDDGNPCTDDFCSPTSGCLHQANNATCNDGNPCTAVDFCAFAKCFGVGATNCNDNNVCTEDSCAPGQGCKHVATAKPKACDDGSLCTVADSCVGGVCSAGSQLVCDDKNPCTTDTCDAKSGCTFTNNTAACDDGSKCTTGDVCANGKCGATNNPCNDGNPCTSDGCDGQGGCTHALMADGGACSAQGCSGGVFQGAATCQSGVCGGVPSPVSCDDGNACTDDVCNGGSGCLHAFNTAPCSDGNVCTSGDACASGACAGVAIVCAAGGPCAASLGCDAVSGCQYQALSGTPCNDGNACTLNDACAAGLCSGAAPMVCDDNNACTTDSCDPSAGCVWSPLSAGACSDGNVCTGSVASPDTCVAGVCVGGAVKPCDDANPCTNDSCDPTVGCKNVNNTAACKDGNPCTTGDACSGGSCQPGAPIVCDDGNPCTKDSCDPQAGCIAAKVANGTACGSGSCSTAGFTAPGTCTSGQCILPAPKSCDDGIDCTADACDPTAGCSSAAKPWGTACTPTNAALLAPFCANTTCTGFQVKVGEPGTATQGALTSVDRNASGVFASGWNNGFTAGAVEGDVRAVNTTTLAVTQAGTDAVATARMNDCRDVLAVGGVGDNAPAFMAQTLLGYFPVTVSASPAFSRAFYAVDTIPTATGETFVFAGGSNSGAEFQTNVGLMNGASAVGNTASRLLITTSPTQCDVQVPMTVNDVYVANNAAIYFAGYIGKNGLAPTQSAVAVWDGSLSHTCDGIDFTYAGEVYINTPTSSVDRTAAISSALGQGAYRTIHGTGPSHLLVGGTQGTLWSFDNGAWTQQTPVVPGGTAWSTQFDVKSVYLFGNDGWVTGELYGTNSVSTSCRQIFVLHGVFSPAAGIWAWNQLALPGLSDCGASIANTQANKIWRDASGGAVYVVGSWGGQELVARIQLP